MLLAAQVQDRSPVRGVWFCSLNLTNRGLARISSNSVPLEFELCDAILGVSAMR